MQKIRKTKNCRKTKENCFFAKKDKTENADLIKKVDKIYEKKDSSRQVGEELKKIKIIMQTIIITHINVTITRSLDDAAVTVLWC